MRRRNLLQRRGEPSPRCKLGLVFALDYNRRTIENAEPTKRMKAHYFDLSIRVLIYKEDAQFVAHGLELDILAYGSTELAAKKALEGLLDNQLSFAACLGKPEAVHFPAPKEFFDRWEKANRLQLTGKPVSEKSLALHGKPSVFVYSEGELKKLRTTARKKDFSKADDLVAA